MINTENLNKVTSFSKILAAILFVLLPFIGFYIGNTYSLDNINNYSTISNENNEVVLVRNINKDKQENIPVVTNNYKYAYSSTITRDKSVEWEQTSLLVSLSKRLNLEVEDIEIYHGDDFEFPKTKASFYIKSTKELPVGEALDLDGNYKITINQPFNTLLPYLLDGKYCKTDADCSSTARFCDIGSYNEFHPFAVFGCESINIDSVEGLTEKQKFIGKNCPADPNIDINSVACISNQCTVKEVSVSCN